MPKTKKLAAKKQNRILVTSALPYANGPIHLGHLVEYIQTDIYVRFLKLTGKDAIYICADDTHGAPIEINAKKQGITPEELISRSFKEHLSDFNQFFIHFDSYYSTNSKENKHYADLIFTRLKEGGHIYTKEVEQTFCPSCKRFLPDRYVRGTCPKCGAQEQYGDVCESCNAVYHTTDLVKPYCAECKATPIRKSSSHYFFRLNNFSEKLEQWLSTNKTLQPEIVNYIQNWIKEGLKDWDITRDGPYFGFKIVGETDKYYYVWLDAPIGYISSTANYCQKNNRSVDDYWVKQDSQIYHFIGKDIIYFHFLFWPAMLMGSGFRAPNSIFVHGFLTVNGQKMSKSRGTFLTAKDYLALYKPEYLRFYYAKLLSKRLADINLDFAEFAEVVNSELVSNIANFCYRVLSFCHANFEGKVGKPQASKELSEQILGCVKEAQQYYGELNSKEAIKKILQISSLGNKYFQEQEVWKLVKTDKQKAYGIVSYCVNVVKILAILLTPVLPDYSQKIRQQLALPLAGWSDINFNLTNHQLSSPSIVFEKIQPKPLSKPFPLQLVVGKILSVKDHPNADSLYVVDVDLGKEKRTLVAGVKKYYSSKELIGHNVVVVANLEPATLRGVLSNGMLLAADAEGKLKVLSPEGKPGDVVCPQGFTTLSDRISYKAFTKIKFSVQSRKVFADGAPLMVGNTQVSVEMPDGATVR